MIEAKRYSPDPMAVFAFNLYECDVIVQISKLVEAFMNPDLVYKEVLVK